jgi:hypothetical protein
MDNYEKKYLKYKQKYLNLKLKTASTLHKITNTDPPFTSPSGISSVYSHQIITNLDHIIHTLSDSTQNVLILKLGSNDLNTGFSDARKGTCYFLENGENLLYNCVDKPLDQSDNKINGRLLNQIYPLTNYGKKFLLQIDPNDKTFIPFLPQTDEDITEASIYNIIKCIGTNLEESNSLFIKSEFPLSVNPSSKPLLDMIVGFNGILVLFNAISGQCYGSLKYIIDLRNIYGKNTIYCGVANNAITAGCEITKPKHTIQENGSIQSSDPNY